MICNSLFSKLPNIGEQRVYRPCTRRQIANLGLYR